MSDISSSTPKNTLTLIQWQYTFSEFCFISLFQFKKTEHINHYQKTLQNNSFNTDLPCPFLRTRIRFKTLTTNDLRVQEPPPALWFTTANHTETPKKTCWNNEGGKIPYGNNQMRNKMITCFRALPSANYQIDVIARENEWIVEVLIAKAASSICTCIKLSLLG